MVRRLALAVSLALGTVSVPAHALGLGDIDSKSLLNQNFQGEIRLLSVQPDELDSIRVKLGEAQAFERAGIERPFYLSLLKFEPQLSASGQPVIRITSDFPIREPFLNFLVEVNWPKGRLLREFTVLLDPPTTTNRRPPSVAPAARVSRPAVARTTAPAETPAGTGGRAAGGSEYGPVKANDTAWSLAKQLRPRGVSMEQMMMALLEANPRAFIDGNINRLRRGQILRVPALDEIQQLSRQQARTAYRQQQDEWLAQRDQKLQAAATEPAAGGAPVAAEQPVATETADTLRIATARPDGEGEAGAGDDDAVSPTADDLQSRLIVARENAETSRQEAETLRSRVDDLQARLADMQKLLSLKDNQLAQLQDSVATDAFLGESEVADAQLTASGESVEAVPEAGAVADYRIQDIPPQIDADRVVEAAADVAGEGMPGSVAAGVADISGQAAPGPIVEAAGGVEVQGVPLTVESTVTEVPPQVDPDRIVALADANGVLPVDVLDGESAGQTAEVPVVPPVEAAFDSGLTVEPSQNPSVGAQSPVVAAADPFADSDPAGEAIATETVIEIEDPAVGGVEQAMQAAPGATEPVPTVGLGESSTSEPAAVEPAVTEAQPASPLLGMLQQNMLPIAAGGVGLLGLVGWLVARRRREDDDGPETPRVVDDAAVVEAAAELPPEVEADLEPSALGAEATSESQLRDSAFLDEFSPSDINALQDETGEVDPVSEADVYIAYGRYQQAEDLLHQAMEREPDRLALKHKLLEVHYATRSPDAYVKLAQQMADAGQDAADEEAWKRAQDMGRELAPENPLFAAPDGEAAEGFRIAAAGAAGAAAASVDSDTLTLDDAELSELTAAYDEPTDTANDLEAPSEVSIMLDMDDSVDVAARAPDALEDSAATSEFASIDFELPTVEKEDGPTPTAEQGQTGDDPLDLDSMLAEAESVIDREDSLVSLDSDFSPDDLQAQLDELSDLSMFDSDLEAAADESAPSGIGLVSEDSGSGDVGLDEPLNLDSAFEMAEEAAEAAPGSEMASAEAGVEGEDDVETKLDLARAYVDMGDEDGARSILQEVVVEGSDTQRDDAQQLLSSLG